VERGRRTGAAAVQLAMAVSGCASPAGPSAAGGTSGAKVTVTARSLPDVTTVLVTGKGYALYMFEPDRRRAVTCTAVCAGTWPPLMLPSGAALAAGPGIKASLLGSDPAVMPADSSLVPPGRAGASGPAGGSPRRRR